MAKIYTKRGDAGQTQLVGGISINKGDSLLEIYGGLDEINSFIGLAKSINKGPTEGILPWTILNEVQQWLFKLGSHVATPADKRVQFLIQTEFHEQTKKLEAAIDEMTTKLPPLKNFIVPGGSASSSALHITRTQCRRVERALVRYLIEHPNDLSEDVLPFINRLSDLLFVASRHVNMLSGVEDNKVL